MPAQIPVLCCLMWLALLISCTLAPTRAEQAKATAVLYPADPTNPNLIPATFTAVPPIHPWPTARATAPAAPAPLATATLQIPAGYRRAIGFSAQNRPIHSYQFGQGSDTVVFVGGLHGGYEWNTSLLAYEVIDYFREWPEAVPPGLKLFIIPGANPDGLALITGQDGRFTPDDVAADTFPGRFNGNQVDLNRNWACDWSAAAVWRDEQVGAGGAPFSEPETRALRDFLQAQQPTAVVFWHSAANGVYPGDCGQPFTPSLELAQLYSTAAHYPLRREFTSYAVTGDASNWLAAQGIPAITVELKSDDAVEWEQNLAGIMAVLQQAAP